MYNEEIADIESKRNWVRDNEDINYNGESEDFRKGFVEALEWVLNN